MITLALCLYLAIQNGLFESNCTDELVDDVRQMAPHLDEATAKLHAEAALIASLAGSEPELLLAMVYVESRFEPKAVSHPARGKRFCGVLQVYAPTETACKAMQPLAAGYIAGALALRSWLRLARGDLHDALNGYGCGMYGLKNGCRRYAERVLALRARMVASEA